MNVDVTTDELYFGWLYEFVADPECSDPSRSYLMLCAQLYKLPFSWSIDMDENRAHDGLELRDEYVKCEGDVVPIEWYQLDCSIFEMLIALSRRAAFQSSWSPSEWFFKIVENLGLGGLSDDVYKEGHRAKIRRAAYKAVNRSYRSDGRGGFFPLRDPGRDQREVELWYQLSAYLQENFDY